MERPDLEALCRLRPDDGQTGSYSVQKSGSGKKLRPAQLGSSKCGQAYSWCNPKRPSFGFQRKILQIQSVLKSLANVSRGHVGIYVCGNLRVQQGSTCARFVIAESKGLLRRSPEWSTWSRISSRNTILLARLALFCVEHADMGRHSAAIGLKSDPTMLPI